MNPLMRSLKFTLTLVFCVLILAACGGDNTIEPTATSTPADSATPEPASTLDASPEPTLFYPFPSLTPLPTALPFVGTEPEMTAIDDGVQPGGVGTLVAVGTVNPDLPQGFDSVILIRSGGPANEQGETFDETIIIERDGKMTRNGATGTASQTAMRNINEMLVAVNFFAIQANFIGAVPLEGPRPYTYQLVVRQGFAERMITAEDGMMPREIQALVAAVLTEGFKIERP